MDLTDAVRRVLFHHARLIGVFFLLGLLVAAAVATLGSSRYTSSARVMLVDPVSHEPEAIEGVADAAGAIVTSRGVVEEAIADVGVSRTAVAVRTSILVEPLASSGALEISVTDGDPSVAAALTNALSRELVRRWPGSSGNTGAGFLAGRIDSIDTDLDRINAQMEELAAETDPQGEEADDRIRGEQRRTLGMERAKLAQLRLALQTEMDSMLAQEASGIEPRIIDRAAPSTDPDPSHALPITALGMLIGGIVGIGAAASIESVRPTVVGAHSIADELGVPVLGRIPSASEAESGQYARLARSLHLAAANSDADTVELVSVEPSAELSPLVDVVEASASLGHPRRRRTSSGELVVRPFGAGWPESNGDSNAETSTALVAVLPDAVRRARLREVHDLRRLTTWPLIGIVTYPASGAARLGHAWARWSGIAPPEAKATGAGARLAGKTGNGPAKADA